MIFPTESDYYSSRSDDEDDSHNRTSNDGSSVDSGIVSGTTTLSLSLRDEITTEHSESTVISTPVTMILVPPLIHSSIRDMSEPLSVSEMLFSLARYDTDVGDSGKQANNGVSMTRLVTSHSLQERVSCFSTAVVMSSNLTSLSDFYISHFVQQYMTALVVRHSTSLTTLMCGPLVAGPPVEIQVRVNRGLALVRLVATVHV